MKDGQPSQRNESDTREDTQASVSGFPDTVWDDVRRARDRDGVIAVTSLARIASRYWYPVYFLIRHKGRSSDEAKALTEEFFRSFLEEDLLSCSPGTMGKFRKFLAASVKRLLDPERRPGPGTSRPVPLPSFDGSPEDWHPFEPAAGEEPEDAFMKNWAKCVVDVCVGKLREECRRLNRGVEFSVFEARYLRGKRPGPKEIADSLVDTLGIHEVEVEEHLKAVEQRYRRIVQNEVMTWVSSPEEGLEELNDLLSSLG